MDYYLTDHIPFNAVFTIIPVLMFLLIKHFSAFEHGVYRSFYLVIVIVIVEGIIHSRPEQATTTYWAYLIIILIFTYEKTIRNAIIINGLSFLSLSMLAVLDYLSFIELPYSQFNYLSFLMIYVVLSAFVFIMVRNSSGIEAILHSQSLTLQHNVDELHSVQQSLIEAEKMAALGGLVAGISHEINTPLGIALTAITHNQDHLINIEKCLKDKTLKKSSLNESINAQQHGYRIILKNLDRANNLIGHFKQVAVDQASENLREIYIYEYIQEIVDSMYSILKKKKIQIHFEGLEGVKVNTYPGPIYQIMSNFINNSILHGFASQE
jgi:signal transduction histidine kinase